MEWSWGPGCHSVNHGFHLKFLENLGRVLDRRRQLYRNELDGAERSNGYHSGGCCRHGQEGALDKVSS